MAFITIFPRPGIENIFSIITVPPRIAPILMPINGSVLTIELGNK